MFHAYGLYTHIQANRLRSLLLLAGFVVLLLALMFAVALLYEASQDGTLPQIMARALRDLEHGWPIAFGAAGLWFVIAYFFHQKLIDAATGAGDVTREDAPRLYNLLENLCISRGIPMPSLKIIEDGALNAYASGVREGHYAVTVTRGLMETLDDAEIEAVLGHELTHIRNRDVQLMVVAAIFVGIFAFVGDLVFRNWGGFRFSSKRATEEGRDRGVASGAGLAIVIALAIIALSWGLSVLIRFAISRSRELLADAGSVELTKNPDAMISALRKIETYATMPDMPSRMGAFFIESPARKARALFSTHPSVDDRVAALVRYAGGRDMPKLEPPPAPIEDHGPWEAAPAPTQAPGFLPSDGRSPLDPPSHGPWG
ncbi:M48 family metallopeptidase [Methylosinus sp. H3A]|uniref:M48 family metallopeptidase n=1 Tax=Methylosinus sp. H3A TaxID=2785786 RepID=UPI0018C1E3B6|nr:M48 family metallopeptidase [Methylosinus sp. H3A]MBG0809408.1 M48 family metallopeptidase [Methylosinus sp. H3A]